MLQCRKHHLTPMLFQSIWLKSCKIVIAVVLIAVLFAAVPVKADTPLPAPQMVGEFEAFDEPVAMGSSIYFRVWEGSTVSIWRSQGTPQTTEQFFNPPGGDTFDSQLFVYKDKLFFSVSTGMDSQTYVSDGTGPGTGPLTGVKGQKFQIYGDWLMTWGQTGDSFKLWRTDGTPEGTSLVGEISGTRPSNLWIYNNLLVFWVQTGDTIQLWKSDGTAGGTAEVKEFDGVAESVPLPYLLTATSSGDRTLWYSDLTEAGTVALLQYNISTASLSAYNNIQPIATSDGGSILINQKVYSTGDDDLEIWKTDNTTADTVNVATFSDRGGFYLGDANNLAYFVLNNEAPDADTVSLWQTDGTESGTERVVADLQFISIKPISNFNGSYYFLARSSVDDYFYIYQALGKDDGGFHQIRAFKDSVSASSGYYSFVPYKGKLYYPDMDNGHMALFYIEGDTATATGDPQDKFTNAQWFVSSQSGSLFFNARPMDDYDHVFLYITDGTGEGTQQYFAPDPSIRANEWPEFAQETSDTIYFRTGFDSSYPTRLWAAQLTPAQSQFKIYLPAIQS